MPAAARAETRAVTWLSMESTEGIEKPMSPRSTTRNRSRTSWSHGHRPSGNSPARLDSSRMALGPSRVPERFVVPRSKGTPTTAISASSGSDRVGSRAKDRGPAKVIPKSRASNPSGISLMASR